MTPFDLLVAIDSALARPGRRPLELRTPTVSLLGRLERGRHVRDDEGGPVYGYTRRQCRRMQQRLYEAARDDLGA